MSAKKANEKTGCIAVTEAMVEAWVGAKVFSRAKAIVCNVGEIGQKADGDYVAAVFGGGDFVCSVGLGKDGSFVSECTCEAGCDCEHAAAVMLAVIQAQKAKVTLPTIADGDPRLLRLDDDSQSKKRTLSAGEKKVVAWLESLDARNRLLLLVELMQKHPGVMHDLQQQSVAKGCSDRELIAQTKAAIKNVKDSCDWRRARGERRPDYTPVKECLERLLERGLREPFPMLGELLYTDSEKLFRKFPRHIEDIRVGANEVFKTIVKEVHEGPLSDVEKLLWEHDLLLRDEGSLYVRYEGGLLEECSLIWKSPHKVTMNTWLEVAEELEKRLLAKGKGLYYEEEEKLRKAFENAGREGRILSYEMKTAEKPYECHEVAKKLMAVGRLEEAEQMCKKGMNDQTWWRDSLMELLREIARMRKR